MVNRQHHTEAELVALLKRGDEGAFTAIYHQHWAVVYNQVYRVLRDAEESRDVIQEVFGNLWNGRERLADHTNIGAFLYVQARNCVFNIIAKQRVRSDYIASIGHYMEQADAGAVDLLEEQELLARVEQAIAQLPPRMREIFELSRKEDLSHREIAEKLGLSEQTVKKQVQNALKIIKPRLQAIGGVMILLFLR